MAQINRPTDYFNTKLYTGNGSTQSITGVGFQPDFTWIKERDTANEYHNLYDVIRGATNAIYSNDTLAESTQTGLTSFDSDGFSVGSFDIANKNTSGYVSWNWLAGGTASENTDGDITSQVSANPTSGFSIVSFTGNGSSDQQVGHGLATTPTFYITKDRTNGSTNWHYHTTQIDGGMDYGLLNTTGAFASSSLAVPSSTTIRVGGTINTSSANFISYVFAEKKGYSKFGSFSGNSSTNGSFVFCGFRPAMVICKASSTSGDWKMFDSKRIGYNAANYRLQPNSSAAETSDNLIDFLSNGFKLRTSSDSINTASTVIYLAFAEQPLVGTNNIPATAR